MRATVPGYVSLKTDNYFEMLGPSCLSVQCISVLLNPKLTNLYSSFGKESKMITLYL